MRAALFLLLILALPAQGGEIRLAQTLTAQVDGERLSLTVQVENQGQETALKVQPVVHFLGRAHPLPVLERLEPRAFYRQSFQAELPGPGDYAVLVDLRYHSPRAGYSLPAYIQVPAQSQPGSLEIRLGKGAKGPFLLVKNHASTALDFTLTLLAPWELGLTPPQAQQHLPPGGERILELHFASLDVAHQSTALVHALADYQEDDRHRIAHAALDLHTGHPLAAVPWSLIAGAAALLLAFLLAAALRRAPR